MPIEPYSQKKKMDWKSGRRPNEGYSLVTCDYHHPKNYLFFSACTIARNCTKWIIDVSPSHFNPLVSKWNAVVSTPILLKTILRFGKPKYDSNGHMVKDIVGLMFAGLSDSADHVNEIPT